MKSLLLMRHAKSSWSEADLPDHDRPLNERGRKDAPRMGKLLRREGVLPGLIISSTALRARTTAELAAQACGYTGEVLLTDALYNAAPAAYLTLAQGVADEVECLMLVGHNPGLEELVLGLTGQAEAMPTAAMAHIRLPIARWQEVEAGVGGTLDRVFRPKKSD